ncbi:MAG: glycosyltransferase family 4 protein [Rhizobiaceae bacterium]
MACHILYVITKADLGGAQANVYDLAVAFSHEYQVTLLVGETGPLTERLVDKKVTVHVLPTLNRQINPISDLRAIFDLYRFFRKAKPKIVHAHSTKAGFLTRVATRLAGTRSIYTVHGWAFDLGAKFVRRALVWPMEALAIPFTDQIVLVSQYDREFARKYWLPLRDGNCHHIPYGVRPSAPQARPGIKTKRPIVVMPARFMDQKDHETMIRAASLIHNREFEIRFIGDGIRMEQCRKLVVDLGLEDKIKFLGARSDVPIQLQSAHIFALITRHEGLPISIMEAMRARLPVVATNVSGIAEEVEHGKTGLLAAYRDPTSVANCLTTLIDSPEQRTQMGNAGYRKFIAEYVQDRMFERYSTLYRSMLTN